MRRRNFLESGATLTLGAMAFGTIEIIQAQPQPTLRKSIDGLTAADPLVQELCESR